MRFNIFIDNKKKDQIFINVFYIFNILLNLIFQNQFIRLKFLFKFV